MSAPTEQDRERAQQIDIGNGCCCGMNSESSICLPHADIAAALQAERERTWADCIAAAKYYGLGNLESFEGPVIRYAPTEAAQLPQGKDK